MEIFKFLNKALWITIFLFALYWLAKYIYNKLKPATHPFFYFHSIEKNSGEWNVRIEAPDDDLILDIQVLIGNKLIVTKNARLKTGINKIILKSPELESELSAILKISSEDQKLERSV